MIFAHFKQLTFKIRFFKLKLSRAFYRSVLSHAECQYQPNLKTRNLKEETEGGIKHLENCIEHNRDYVKK